MKYARLFNATGVTGLAVAALIAQRKDDRTQNVSAGDDSGGAAHGGQ